MQKSGRTILAADANTYKLINERSGVVTPSFPYDRSVLKPLVCVISNAEFLVALGTPQGIGLGMFVNANGDAIRGTIEWGALPKSVVFQFPYIIALLRNDTVEVHNIFSQELVETLEIPSEYQEPRLLHGSLFPFQCQDTDSSSGETSPKVLKVLVLCRDAVLALQMQSLSTQIENFLSASPTKAITLMEHCLSWTIPEEIPVASVYQRAGFSFFRSLDFSDALKCFKKGEVDPLLILSTFGEVLIESASDDDRKAISEFVHVSAGGVDAIVKLLERRYLDVEKSFLDEVKKEQLQKAKETIISYITFCREKDFALNSLEDVDDFLLVFHDQSNNSFALQKFLSEPNFTNVKRAEIYLTARKRYYALSVLYRATGQSGKLLDIWQGFLSGEYQDSAFDKDEIVKYMLTLPDESTVLNYSQRILELDAKLGLQCFLKGSVLSLSKVVPIIERYDRDSLASYIEAMLDSGKVSNTEVKEAETLLKSLYLTRIESLFNMDGVRRIRIVLVKRSNELTTVPEREYISHPAPRPTFMSFIQSLANVDPLTEARAKLLQLSLRTNFDETDGARLLVLRELAAENAAVYLSRGDVTAALRVLVCEVFDYISAEEVCLRFGGGKWLEALVDVYLDGYEDKYVPLLEIPDFAKH
ncbi:transforming growth factor, beta receptor associated protein 1 [Entophlyctis sp. JEL0112]|nr:transforming growth factor, beta receptor associated protein 1 [Entophlyctis sp. JEL0112]